jgi:hypothetical protein
MRALLLLGLMFSAQVYGNGEIGADLLVCAQSTGAVKGQCKLETLPLATMQAYEKDFAVEYEYSCIGPATDFQLRAVANTDPANPIFIQLPFSFTKDGKAGTLSITGYGPVDIYDAKPDRTLRRPFSKDCSFVVKTITQKPSSNTIQDWQKQLNEKRTLLASYKDNLNAFGALAVMEPAFGIFDKFITNVLKDKVANAELVEAAGGLLDCSDGTTDEGCLTLMDTLVENYRAASLTDDEAAKLRKLQRSLNAADLSGVLTCKPEDTGCTRIDLFLNKYLTPDDRKSLDDARKKLAVVKGSETKYQEYAKLVKETEDAIEALKTIAGSNVQ